MLAVNADSQILSSAVTNLLNNAFKFTRAGGRVVLRADRKRRVRHHRGRRRMRRHPRQLGRSVCVVRRAARRGSHRPRLGTLHCAKGCSCPRWRDPHPQPARSGLRLQHRSSSGSGRSARSAWGRRVARRLGRWDIVKLAQRRTVHVDVAGPGREFTRASAERHTILMSVWQRSCRCVPRGPGSLELETDHGRCRSCPRIFRGLRPLACTLRGGTSFRVHARRRADLRRSGLGRGGDIRCPDRHLGD